MNFEHTEIDWVAERLPEAPEPDEVATARARQALMTHLADPARDTDLVVESVAGHRRRRPRRLQLGVLGAGLAAAAFVGVNLSGSSGSTSGGPSTGPAVASAATIKAHALAVVAPDAGSILEIDAQTTQADGPGKSVSWDYHVWSGTGASPASRIVQSSSSAPTAESATTADGRQELYDPAANTIYRYVPPRTHYRFAPGSSPGTQTLTVASARLFPQPGTPAGATLGPGERGTTRLTLTDAQVQALKSGAATIAYELYTKSASGVVVGHKPQFKPAGHSGPTDFAAQFTVPIMRALRDPNAVVDRSATLDGRPAITVTSTRKDGGVTDTTEYWAAPGSLQPLQEVSTAAHGDPSSEVTITTTFATWRTLTGAAASPDLLSLAAQHPSAVTADAGQAKFDAVQETLFPNG